MKPSIRDRLLAEGWEERFSASGARLAEVADFYRSLGFEVRVEEVTAAAPDGACTNCFAVPGSEGPAGIVFTRAAAGALGDEDDLFEE